MTRPLARLGALRGWRALCTAFLLGALGALAMPPVHAVPVLLVSIPGLLVLIGNFASWRRAALLGFAWGWGHHIAGLYWITHAILVDVANFWWLVPIAAPALAIPMALYAVPPALVARALPPGWPRLAGFAGAFVLAEIARGILFTGFPWNLMGTVWAFGALPIQGAAVIGTHGLSLVTLLLAGLPLLSGWRPWLLGGAVLAGFAGFGAWRLALPEPAGSATRLVLIQANVAQEAKWREDQRMPNFRRYIDLTEAAAREAAAAHPDERLVVIWPETASPYLLAQDAGAQRLAAAALPPGARLLAGTVRVDFRPDGRAERIYNSLVVLNDAARVLAVYDKSHLVPFGEYMPLSGALPIRLAAGGMDFTAGPGPVRLDPGGMPPFGALICYEVIFPAEVTPAQRPDWLVNITNDAWYGISAGPWQHLATARMRAVEEALPLARAAQSGISAVFDSRGALQASLPLGEAGSFDTRIPAPGAPGFFARFGLAVPALLAILVLSAGFSRLWFGQRRLGSAAQQ